MACDVTITSVVGISTLPGMTDAVRVSGTSVDCDGFVVGNSSIDIQLSVECIESGVTVEGLGKVEGGVWEIEIPFVCSCNSEIVVQATCVTDPACNDTFTGVIICEDNVCPVVEVSVSIGECNPDGTRAVTLTSNVISLGSSAIVVAEWDYGDSSSGSAFTIPALGVFSEIHNYASPGPYTATLNYVLPEGCPADTIEVSFSICEPDCPEIESLTVSVSPSCDSDGNREVTLDAILSGGAPETYHWEFGTPDAATNTIDATLPGATPEVTHPYPAPGSGTSTYTAIFTVTGFDPSCVDSSAISVDVPGCGGECPELTDITIEALECNEAGDKRTIRLGAVISGGGIAEYVWDFGDASPLETIDATVTPDPTIDHSYNTPGDYTASLTINTVEGCDDQTLTKPVNVPACGDGDDGSSGCGSLLFLVAGLFILATSFTVFYIAITTCPALGVITLPTWIGWVIAGMWIAVAAAIALWYFLCWLDICDCPSACDWLAIGWMTSLATAVIAFYLTGCCTGLWTWLAIALAAAFVASFASWIAACEPSRCKILDLLLITLATVAATTITYIALWPVIHSCGLVSVEISIATLVAALGIAVPACHAAE